jgi:DNA-binding MarR family transcriptional regulator
MEKTREDLLQNLVQRLMSVMKHVRHQGPPGGIMLSPPQGNLLFIIGHRPDGMSVKELAEFTAVTPGAITQIIDPLVEKGLVMREGDPTDRRVVRLKITEFARKEGEKFRQEHLSSFSKVFEVLNNEEIEQLIMLMDKIESSLTIKEKVNAEPDKTP